MKSRLVAVLVLLLSPTLFARQQVPSSAAHPTPAVPRGFEAEFLSDFDVVQKKVLDLAAAVPADKYTWRPGEGVRSVSEVYMHIAGGNYFLATFLGAKAPADLPADLEKITDKPTVIAALQKSFAFTRALVKNTPEADLDKIVLMYGKPTTQRAVLTTILSHIHEHLGQSIAYARINGIVPPWSR